MGTPTLHMALSDTQSQGLGQVVQCPVCDLLVHSCGLQLIPQECRLDSIESVEEHKT